MISKILEIIENLLKPVPNDKKAEDSWSESDIYGDDDTDDKDPFDSKGHLNRLSKLHQDARKSTKRNPNHPN